ncbi:MAG: energy transducer TonB [Gammaproteobacteria bacterium]
MIKTICGWAGLVCTLMAGPYCWAETVPPAESEAQAAQATSPSPSIADDAGGFADAHPSLAVMPRYPKSALRKKTDGKATIGFDINRYGRAENIRIVEEFPKRAGFGKEAAETLEYWAFSPARLPLCGTSQQYAEQTFVFDHDGDPTIDILPLVVDGTPQPQVPLEKKTLEQYWEDQKAAKFEQWESRNFVVLRRVEPDYPLQALDRRKEGVVSLVFLIGRDGGVSNVEVVDSVRGNFFQKPALSAIRQWRFEPRRRNGMPVESVACHEFVFHIDEYERSGKLSKERQRERIKVYQ